MRHAWILVAVVSITVGIVLVGGRTPVDAQEATPSASPASVCPTTTEDENEALAVRWHEDAINSHDRTVLDEILAPNPAHESATIPTNPGPRAVLSVLLTGFPDVRHTIEAVITEGDNVVVRFTATGTHEGEFQGYAPTGERVSWSGINIFRVECGRIAEIWSEVDALGRIAQLAAGESTTPVAGTPTP